MKMMTKCEKIWDKRKQSMAHGEVKHAYERDQITVQRCTYFMNVREESIE